MLMVTAAPGIRAVAIFEGICRRHPEIAQVCVERWSGAFEVGARSEQEVIFRQEPRRVGFGRNAPWRRGITRLHERSAEG